MALEDELERLRIELAAHPINGSFANGSLADYYDGIVDAMRAAGLAALTERKAPAESTPSPDTEGVEQGPRGFSIIERDDDMLIVERHWQFGWRCIARRPKLMTNEQWRPDAERIVAALCALKSGPPVSTVDEEGGGA